MMNNLKCRMKLIIYGHHLILQNGDELWLLVILMSYKKYYYQKQKILNKYIRIFS